MSLSMGQSDEILFEGWTLRRKTGELLKGGSCVRLQSQPLLVLEELLAHPGELVTREELIALLWPQGVVEFDTALNSTVHRLRTVLNDPAETPRFIETIPRRGYRFIGQLDVPRTAPAKSLAVTTARGAARLAWQPMAASLTVAIAIIGYFSFQGRVPVPDRTGADSQVQELYLRAEFFFQRRAAGDLVRARKYFADALALDPGFARAWAGLAGVHWIQTAEGRIPVEQGLSMVRDAAERALALDPGLAEPHVRLASYRRIIGETREADEHLRKALALEPRNPLVLTTYASLVAEGGRFDEAAGLQQRALEAYPLSQVYRYNLGVYFFFAGRIANAEQEMIKLRELIPATQYAPELYGILLVTTDRLEEALALTAEWPEGADRLYIRALALDGLGRRAEADTALRRLIKSDGAGEGFRIAEVYAYRGDADRAFEWLETGKAHMRASSWRSPGRRPLWLLEYSPFLKPLQAHPRWRAWYASAREPWRRAAEGKAS